MTKKLIYAVVAVGLLVGTAAYADAAYPGAIERGHAGVVSSPGVPVGDLFVSNRTRSSNRNANESPIEGKGRISAVHNEPAPQR